MFMMVAVPEHVLLVRPRAMAFGVVASVGFGKVGLKQAAGWANASCLDSLHHAAIFSAKAKTSPVFLALPSPEDTKAGLPVDLSLNPTKIFTRVAFLSTRVVHTVRKMLHDHVLGRFFEAASEERLKIRAERNKGAHGCTENDVIALVLDADAKCITRSKEAVGGPVIIAQFCRGLGSTHTSQELTVSGW